MKRRWPRSWILVAISKRLRSPSVKQVLAGRRRLAAVIAFVLLVQISIPIGLALRGYNDRVALAIVRGGITALLLAAMWKHNRVAWYVFRALLFAGIAYFVLVRPSEALRVSADRIFLEGAHALYLILFYVLSYGRGVQEYFHRQAKQVLADYRAGESDSSSESLR